ncbi:MAG: winged helix-turn-helix transcriptional regulator [Rhodospirillales bacterium]|nr:winged helix-turn-helix transcriptional regulator [Rhodospirillales bacterium]
MGDFRDNAKRASTFLKSLANPNRLVILCALAEGEKNVGQLQDILGIHQPTLSQQLARLRADNMVSTRRESKQIYYNLASDEAEIVMGLVFDLFCAGGSEELKGRTEDQAESEAA